MVCLTFNGSTQPYAVIPLLLERTLKKLMSAHLAMREQHGKAKNQSPYRIKLPWNNTGEHKTTALVLRQAFAALTSYS